MIDDEVNARMAEYEARRNKEIEVLMIDYKKSLAEETTVRVKQMLEDIGFHVPSLSSSPLKVHSSVGQVNSMFNVFINGYYSRFFMLVLAIFCYMSNC